MDPVPLFWLRTLTSAARAELMDGLEERTFPAGRLIVRRGDPAATSSASAVRLSRRLRAEEGVPPLHAATREILSAVLEAPA